MDPRGPPGTSREPARSLPIVIDSSLSLKTGLDRAPGGSGEVPGHLQGPPRNHFGMIFGRFLKSVFRETAMATLPFLWTLSSNSLTFSSLLSCGHVSLIRSTDGLYDLAQRLSLQTSKQPRRVTRSANNPPRARRARRVESHAERFSFGKPCQEA